MIDLKILEKIRKLLALSKSDNEHEAAVASLKAKELLDRYQLDMSDVDQLLRDKVDPVGQERMASRQIPHWKKILVNAICKAYYCDKYFDGNTLQIVGRETNRAIALEIQRYLISTFNRITRDHMKKVRSRRPAKYRSDFMYGMAVSVAIRLVAKKKVHLDPNREALALVSVAEKESKAIARYFDALAISFRSIQSRKYKANSRTASKGFNAGLDIGLDDQLQSTTDESRLLN